MNQDSRLVKLLKNPTLHLGRNELKDSILRKVIESYFHQEEKEDKCLENLG